MTNTLEEEMKKLVLIFAVLTFAAVARAQNSYTQRPDPETVEAASHVLPQPDGGDQGTTRPMPQQPQWPTPQQPKWPTQPQVQYATVCVTQYGMARMMVQIPVGSPCHVPVPVQTRFGLRWVAVPGVAQ